MQQAPMPPQQQPQPVVQQQQQLEPPVVDLSRSQAIPVLPPDLGRSQLLSQSASSQAQPGPQPSEIEIPQIELSGQTRMELEELRKAQEQMQEAASEALRIQAEQQQMMPAGASEPLRR